MPTVTKLEKPIVSQADASKAKTLLKEKENLAKARNSLYYWLTSKGLHEKFHALPCAERREYLEAWYAERMEDEKMLKNRLLRLPSSRPRRKVLMDIGSRKGS